RFREAVARWPDGRYESDVYVDHDPHGKRDIHIHCAVTVRGSDLTVDFTGSDDRPDIQAYSTYGNTRGYVVAQLASMMDPTIPKNEGFFDAIELIVPKGCCLNPPDGKSVAAGTHHPGTEVGEAVAKALERVIPERTCPQVYKMGMPTVIFGTNPRDGKLFIDHSVDTFAAYCGAVKGQDGWGGMNVSFGNLIRATAEINEAIFPVRHLWRDYETDTGGAGEYRGNCGSLYRKQMLVPATVYTYVVGKRYPMPGIAGGKPGSPNRLVVRAGGPHAFEVGDRAGYIEHAAGECYEYHYGGGGGWGDPLDRPPEKVLEDVLDEYVSVEAARRDYGVVLTGDLWELTLAVDHEATARLRAEMRAARGRSRASVTTPRRGRARRRAAAPRRPGRAAPGSAAARARPRRALRLRPPGRSIRRGDARPHRLPLVQHGQAPRAGQHHGPGCRGRGEGRHYRGLLPRLCHAHHRRHLGERRGE